MPLISPGELARMSRVLGDFANAELTKIETPGTLSISGDPTGWVTAWSGSAPGFLSRVRSEAKDGGPGAAVEAPDHKDEFTFLDGVATALAEAGPDWEGSRVTIIDQRTTAPITTVRTVVEAEHTANGLLDSARLVLDPAGR